MEKKAFVTKELIEEIVKTYPTPFHIYDEKGISNRLSYAGKQPIDLSKATIGLELTDEQANALAEYIKEGGVIIQKINVINDENSIDTLMSSVKEAIRKARIENSREDQELISDDAIDVVTEDISSVTTEKEGE